jgi:hypothetical protein
MVKSHARGVPLKAQIPLCVYDARINYVKEELVKQIKELKAKYHLSELIPGALSTDEQVPEILQRLKAGEAYRSISEWLG